MTSKIILSLIVLSLGWLPARAFQTQAISGVVIDQFTKESLPGANVVLLNHEPLLGTSTDVEGRFRLENVPYGRHAIRVSYLGYKTSIISEILVGSGREVRLTVELSEEVYEGQSVDVVAEMDKDKPVNPMVFASTKAFTVEETQRYAGGLNDPGRLVTVFGGVTSTGGVQSNAISIRGNAPKSVQWRLEGIEIPNPNHFAGLSVAGGGGLTLFSSQLLANSDFMTGAFPPEYGNALSGVFDINFKTGNPNKREYAFKIGINGLEASSGGPIKKGGRATYLFNYRFSTLTLLMPVLPTEGTLQYQDLSFKLDFPTQKAGRFSVWGVGGLDKQTLDAKKDTSKWEYAYWDFSDNEINLGVGAAGISHNLLVNPTGYIKTSLAVSANLTDYSQDQLNTSLQPVPHLRIHNQTGRLSLKSYLNQKIGRKMQMRTGFESQQLYYSLQLDANSSPATSIQNLIDGDGRAQLLQVYSQFKVDMTPAIFASAGLHGQWFSLNDEFVLEPRMGLSWSASARTTFNVAYGLHSQIEDLGVYHVRRQGGMPNRSLKMAKAHHLVLGWEQKLGEHHKIKTELFGQYLFDVPVIPDSSYSMLNFVQDFTFNEALINAGNGKNYGIEFTFERYLHNNFYYLLTGTWYKSRYSGGDGVWRNGRFDQTIAANVLAGKEFFLRNNRDMIGVNARFNITGGERYGSINQQASSAAEEVIFYGDKPFVNKFDPYYILDVTLNYHRNRKNYTTIWAIQIKNLLMAKDKTFDYNYKTRQAAMIEEGSMVPVLSWEIQF